MESWATANKTGLVRKLLVQQCRCFEEGVTMSPLLSKSVLMLCAALSVAFLGGCPTGIDPVSVEDVGPGRVEDTVATDVSDGQDVADQSDLPGELGPCVPECEGKVCGKDGCGGICGACSDGLVCKLGQCVVGQSICGDGSCDSPETEKNCPEDCVTIAPDCGNGTCEATETAETCPQDCEVIGPGCGNDVCEQGEHFNCPQDCPQPIDCANAQPGTPCCGNHVCDSGENPLNCPEDCESENLCGNGLCDMGENPMNCPDDCNAQKPCGNGICDMGENPMTCPDDCTGIGPTPCTTDNDCQVAEACPAGAKLGCKCALIMGGSTGCVPICQSDSDCPIVEGMTLHCTYQGLCKPGM